MNFRDLSKKDLVVKDHGEVVEARYTWCENGRLYNNLPPSYYWKVSGEELSDAERETYLAHRGNVSRAFFAQANKVGISEALKSLGK